MDELYTVKQISEILGFSKPTIQKAINDLKIQAVRIEKNKYRLYSSESFDIIQRKLKPNFDFSVSEKQENEIEKPKNTGDISQTKTEKSQSKPPIMQTDYMQHLEEEISFLKEQIGKKDAEIERLTAGLLREQQLNYDLQKRLVAPSKESEPEPDVNLEDSDFEIRTQRMEERPTTGKQNSVFSVLQRLFKR